MEVVFDQTGERLESFLEIHNSTMERNNADDRYYFNREFFQNLHNEINCHFIYTYILLNGVVISCGLILLKNAYGFLGSTEEECYDLSPNVNLMIEEIKWLKEKGISNYLMGRGHKGEDGIYQFKKKITQDSDHNYYVGIKIMIIMCMKN